MGYSDDFLSRDLMNTAFTQGVSYDMTWRYPETIEMNADTIVIRWQKSTGMEIARKREVVVSSIYITTIIIILGQQISSFHIVVVK